MRVLHLGKYYPPFAGGMEGFMGALLPTLVTHGAQVTALVHAHSGSIHSQTLATSINGIAVHRVPILGVWLYTPISPTFPLYLHRLLRDFAPDILHLHLPNVSAVWALTDPLARCIPWVIHWHADVLASAQDRRLAWAYALYQPLEHRLLKHSTAIIVTSPPYLASSAALTAWQTKCRVIPLGLDSQLLPLNTDDLHGAETHWQTGGLRVLAIGRMTYYKGHEILLRAVAATPEAQLVLVGDGERRHSLNKLVQTLGLNTRVRLVGAQSNTQVQALLATCDCLCLPSTERAEAFGLVLLEAMRQAKPVIISAVPGAGMSWVISAGETGLQVPVSDESALVMALQTIWKHPEQRQAWGVAGNERFKQHFSIATVSAQIMALYREILDDKRPPPL